ncbi:ribosome modulation factor [Mycolicibacterium lutetiense]
MITADDCRCVRAKGRAAQLHAVNPYAGKSLALAKLWAAGYEDILLEGWYSTPTAQRYLRNR